MTQRAHALALAALILPGCLHLPHAPVASGPPRVNQVSGDRWEVTFTHRPASAEVEHVYLAGPFNGWNPTARAMEGPGSTGMFALTVTLGRGAHPYKFVLDGETWVADPLNPHTDGTEYGNSLVFVGMDPSERDPPRRPIDSGAWLPSDEQAEPTSRDSPNAFFMLRDDGYDEVFVSGDFNGWTGQLDQMERERDMWRLALHMEEPFWTRHRYVVREDDTWRSMHDPHRPWISFDGHPRDSVIFSPDTTKGVTMILTPELTPSAASVESRPIYAWVPPGYFAEPDRTYPLLIMHDGQNAFDDPSEPFGHGGWHVNTAAERLLAEGRIEPFVIVAVPNTPDRMTEYGAGTSILDPDGNDYVRYLIDDVLPLAKVTLRVETGPENVSLMGSSMGGIIAFLGAYHHPDVFGSAACLSSAFMIPDPAELTYERLVRSQGHRPIRLYLDSGTDGPSKDGAPRTRRMRDVLLKSGWTPNADMVWHEEVGAPHNETAWRERVWRPLEFLYGVEDVPGQ